jgi:ATP-binding cassette subfamily B protein
LLNRYYEFDSGRISIDGHDIRSIELSSLRKKVGVVLQEVFLFSNSIRENVRLGDEEITDEQIWKAAENVGASDFIKRLPGGLDYDVQERGATLSAGQRQLISFVRAMVYEPAILVLDEATSSIDSETEHLIQKATEKLMKGRTSIVIAHRLSTIQNADKIVVIDKGLVVEEGSHEQLMEVKGIYHHLQEIQLAHAI